MAFFGFRLASLLAPGVDYLGFEDSSLFLASLATRRSFSFTIESSDFKEYLYSFCASVPVSKALTVLLPCSIEVVTVTYVSRSRMEPD